MATGRDPSATDDMLPGTVVAGRFRIVRELGRGGMARVLEAEDLANGRHIALKLLKADIEQHGEAMERFRREGEFLLSLRHPAIVGVELSGQLPDGRLYLVMELLRGETLGARMKKGRMDPDDLSPILAGAAVGLAAAHRAGVVHRDLKPDNVYLAQNLGDRSLQVKLLDFGISKIDGRATLTRTGQVLGTPRYMAPEQLAAERDLDGRTDVYALGVILYEALAGVPPFPATNPSDLIVSILHGKVVPLRAHRPDLPAELEAVVMRAMARSREARYGTATELAEAWFEVTHQKAAKSPMARADMKTNLLGGMGMVTGASSVAGPSGEIPFRAGTFREFEAHRTALGVPLSGGAVPPAPAPELPRPDKATAPAIALSPPQGYVLPQVVPAQGAAAPLPAPASSPRAAPSAAFGPAPLAAAAPSPPEVAAAAHRAPGLAYAPTDVAPPQRPATGLPATMSSSAVSSPSPFAPGGAMGADSSGMDVVLPTRRVPWLAIGVVTMLVLGSISGVLLVRSFSATAVPPTPAGVDAAVPRDDVPDVSTRDPASGVAPVDAPSGIAPTTSPRSPEAPAAPAPPAPTPTSAPTTSVAPPAPTPTSPTPTPTPAVAASPEPTARSTPHTTAGTPHPTSTAPSAPSPSVEPAAPTPASLVRDARAAFRAGDARRCVELATEALGNGADATAYRVRGDCYRALGDTGHAIRSYQRFCELAPTSGAIDDVRRIVEGLGSSCP